MNAVIDLNGIRKWKAIAPDVQRMFINNVFCLNCGTTTIVDYEIKDHETGVLLDGACEKCHENIKRVVNSE